MIGYSIYIVDDEETIRNGVTLALEADYQVKAFAAAFKPDDGCMIFGRFS